MLVGSMKIELPSKTCNGSSKNKELHLFANKDVSGCQLVGKHVNERLAALWTACSAPTAQHKSILCSAVNVLSGYTCHNPWFHLEKYVSWGLKKEQQAYRDALQFDYT